MGNLLHSYVEVHEPIKVSFGVVSVVGPGISALDGVDMLQWGRGFREFSPPIIGEDLLTKVSLV